MNYQEKLTQYQLDIKKYNFYLKKHLDYKCVRVYFEQIRYNLKDRLNSR